MRDFVARFEGGKNLEAGSGDETSLRILKVSAVTSVTYVETESKPIPDGYALPAHHFLRVGDMLFSRANTEELVGATAFIEATNGKTLLPDKIWRFIWAEPVEPYYMLALFQERHVRKTLGKLSSGTSASMRNISQRKPFDLQLPIAPLLLQQVFAKQAAMMYAACSQQMDASAKAEATSAALLAKVFSEEEEMALENGRRVAEAMLVQQC